MLTIHRAVYSVAVLTVVLPMGQAVLPERALVVLLEEVLVVVLEVALVVLRKAVSMALTDVM